jgi:hypothetical protein
VLSRSITCRNETKYGINTRIFPPFKETKMGKGLQAAGDVSLAIGLTWGFAAYFLPMTGTSGDTYNLGAIANREINVIVAGIFMVSGVLLIGFGHVVAALSAVGTDKLPEEIQPGEVKVKLEERIEQREKDNYC